MYFSNILAGYRSIVLTRGQKSRVQLDARMIDSDSQVPPLELK